jgi:hypothetical protein
MVYHKDMYQWDFYMTGSLETEPEFTEFKDLQWQKKPQKRFTEKGRDSFVFQTTHPRGFVLIVYPYWMVDEKQTGWEYIVFLKGWEHEWDSWEERDGIRHAKSYFEAMVWAVNDANRWKIDPDHPEYPVSK